MEAYYIDESLPKVLYDEFPPVSVWTPAYVYGTIELTERITVLDIVKLHYY